MKNVIEISQNLNNKKENTGWSSFHEEKTVGSVGDDQAVESLISLTWQ